MNTTKKELPEVAVKLRTLRARTGMPRTAFAEYLHGVPLNTMVDWERGHRTPPPYVVAFIEDMVNRDYPEDLEQYL